MDSPLDLGRVNPSHKVLHIPCNQEGRILGTKHRQYEFLQQSPYPKQGERERDTHSDNLGPHSNLSTFNKRSSSLQVGRHLQARENDIQPSARKSRNSDFILHGRQFATFTQNSHIIQFVEQFLLRGEAVGVVWGEEGETVGELAQLAAETIVRRVVFRFLNHVLFLCVFFLISDFVYNEICLSDVHGALHRFVGWCLVWSLI
jgi:hypothetical protein